MKCRIAVVFFLGMAFMAGCNRQSGPETFSVTGTVTMNGTPVSEALVVFTPIDNDDQSVLAAQAETDTEGKFELRTYLGEDDYKAGIQPGEYAVTVTKLQVVQDMTRRPKHLLPQKFSLPKTTPLRASVKVADVNQEFEFSLD